MSQVHILLIFEVVKVYKDFLMNLEDWQYSHPAILDYIEFINPPYVFDYLFGFKVSDYKNLDVLMFFPSRDDVCCEVWFYG